MSERNIVFPARPGDDPTGAITGCGPTVIDAGEYLTAAKRRRGPRVYLNSRCLTLQWWDTFPRYVITLWWPHRGHHAPQLRVYFWRGRMR